MTEQTFLEALDDPGEPWSTLAAWADWLDEQDQTYRARAVRYLLRRNAQPRHAVFEGRGYFTWVAAHPDAGLRTAVQILRRFGIDAQQVHDSRRGKVYANLVGVLEDLAILVEGLQP